MNRSIINFPGKTPRQIVLDQSRPIAQNIVSSVSGSAGIVPFSAGASLLPDGSVPLTSWGTQIRLSSSADNSGVSFRISGYDSNSLPIQEIILGPNNTSVWTTNIFTRVKSIVALSSYTSMVVDASAVFFLYGNTSYSPIIFDNYATKLEISINPLDIFSNLLLRLDGTDVLGNSITETISQNGSAPIVTTNIFRTLNRVIFQNDAPIGKTVNLRSVPTVTSNWINLNIQSKNFIASYQVSVPGTTTYTVNSTLNRVYPVGSNISPTAPLSSSSILSFATAPSSSNAVSAISSGVYAVQMVISATGNSDVSKFTVIQQGVV